MWVLKNYYAAPQAAYCAIPNLGTIKVPFGLRLKVCCYKLLTMLYRQTTMVIEVLFQIRKCTLNLVIRVRHTDTICSLICEEIRQVKVNTIHHRPYSPMEVTCFTIFMRGVLVETLFVTLFPVCIVLFKVFLLLMF